MRIVIVNRHPRDVLGGSEIQCDNIATELTARGHDVAYVNPGGSAAIDYGSAYPVIPVAKSGEAIAASCAAHEPDLVYWRLNRYMFHNAARALRNQRIPVVFAISHIRDTQRVTYVANPRAGLRQLLTSLKEAVVSAYNYRGFKYVDAISSLNPDFLNLLPIEIQRHVPNSVSVDGENFDWPRPYVVWIANLKAAKRPEKFIELARRFEHSGIDFLMFGAIQAEEYHDIVRQGPGNFHYLGPCSFAKSNGVIQRALLLAHTCRPEGFGNNFLQAWLAGRPTVSLGFDPGGYISREQLGGFADDDFEHFVEAVAQLLASAELRQEVGSRAQAFADANFSISRTVDELEVLFGQALSSVGNSRS